MQRSFRLEAANRGPAMSPTQVSLGLEVLTGCQFKIKSYYTKIRKSGFSVRSQIWPLLGPDGGHPSSPELALSKSPKSWLTFSSGMSHLTAAPICQLLTGWPLLAFEVAAPELDAVPAPKSLTIKRHVSYKRSQLALHSLIPALCEAFSQSISFNPHNRDPHFTADEAPRSKELTASRPHTGRLRFKVKTTSGANACPLHHRAFVLKRVA